MNLADSKLNGPHAWLARLAGEWSGTSKLWLEPGVLHEEVAIRGTMRLVQYGTFALHEYSSTCMEQPQSGLAWYGYSFAEDRWTTAWTDSFHNGTRIMFSLGDYQGDTSRLKVLGSYPAPPGPNWGWRTTVELLTEDRLVITHYNITPEGEEAKAVEIDYRRN